ncbi:uncharacterized protein LOC115987424 isoform X2 [Quercus lobata]|uniref:uncharacterized protein LOC115987424 isoform X2 n=1 Tax=Quercus lobata TaxID=97700 RepID=UPI00124675F6|nr:uncharacterized protein LOC115987424 isoform X2 [Quercus lobata]
MTTNIKGYQQEVAEDLFKKTMEGDWKEVVAIYRQHPLLAPNAKINGLGDTALHLAVSLGPENIVEELVKIISEKDKNKEALKIKNELWNNPLHLAASMGTPRMCICIAEAVPELGKTRNKEGESPLFLAALHGKTDIFLCLHFICIRNSKSKQPDTSYYRKNGGETILHCAIKREYLDLAYQILRLHSELATSVDEKGIWPLRLLADKPSAFKSGCHLGWWNSTIYHWITVDALKVINANQLIQKCKGRQSQIFPDNYRACIDFLRLLWKGSRAIFAKTQELCSPYQERKADEEDPTVSSKNKKEDPTGLNVTSKQKALEYFSGCFDILKFVSMPIPVMLGYGGTTGIRKLKEKHILSVKIMKMLIELLSPQQYFEKGTNPLLTPIQENKNEEDLDEDSSLDRWLYMWNIDENKPPEEDLSKHPPSDQPEEKENKKDEGKEEIPKLTMPKEGTSLLFAACNGITEMVEEILKKFPMAIHDTSENKNMILWVVEHRQPHVYELLLKSNLRRDSMFQTKDTYGNSALHLAAMLREHKHWIIPGAALQMQWEIKWYEFVKNNVPQYLLYETNNKDMTPADIFTDTHKDLVKDGGEWLNKTSESCSVVAALIATVAFAASTTIPGGVRENNGTPILEKHAAFDIFAISSLVALCVSVTALFLFLAILTSRYQEKDFRSSLPKKLLFGLTSLFLSIAAMLVSFCAGHFFVLKDKLKHKALPVYVVTCLPITFYAISQFPLYFDLIRAFRKVP